MTNCHRVQENKKKVGHSGFESSKSTMYSAKVLI